jgi:hypothetical protein
MEILEQAKEARTQPCGIAIRPDLSLLVWSGDSAIELQLDVEKLQQLMAALCDVAQDYTPRGEVN